MILTGELVERNIHVEVQVLPEVQPFNTALEAVNEQPFRIQCNATGKPVPEYTWVKVSDRRNVEEGDR